MKRLARLIRMMRVYFPCSDDEQLGSFGGENCFTWNIRIYAGKERDGNASVATNVVINLSRYLLNSGRTIVGDNYKLRTGKYIA
jgi:hypothetical protein